MARSLCVSSDTISNPAKTDVHPWLHRPEQASTRIASPQEPQNTTPLGRAMATDPKMLELAVVAHGYCISRFQRAT